jgi:hypothetical protein
MGRYGLVWESDCVEVCYYSGHVDVTAKTPGALFEAMLIQERIADALLGRMDTDPQLRAMIAEVAAQASVWIKDNMYPKGPSWNKGRSNE